MPEITTTEEMLACFEAIKKLGECGWDVTDEDDQYALRLMWMAGRDWSRQQPGASSAAEQQGDGE